MTDGTCSVDGCCGPVASKGWCCKHYGRWTRTGSPTSPSRRDPLKDRFWLKVEKTGGCWMWLGRINRSGHGAITSGGKDLAAHRVAWELTVGPIPPGAFLCHSCNVPGCVNPDHLYLGDAFTNMADRSAAGNYVPMPGTANPNHKLDDSVVAAIRAAYAAGGISQQEVADQFGISQSHVSRLVRRDAWRHTK